MEKQSPRTCRRLVTVAFQELARDDQLTTFHVTDRAQFPQHKRRIPRSGNGAYNARAFGVDDGRPLKKPRT